MHCRGKCINAVAASEDNQQSMRRCVPLAIGLDQPIFKWQYRRAGQIMRCSWFAYPLTRQSNHAADRWARLVVTILWSEQDVRTLADWARLCGVSRGCLKTWCAAAHTTPKRSLDFARMLRGVVRANNQGYWDLENSLDLSDSRTVTRILSRGDLEGLPAGEIVSPLRFVARQRYVTDTRNLVALRLALLSSPPHSFIKPRLGLETISDR